MSYRILTPDLLRQVKIFETLSDPVLDVIGNSLELLHVPANKAIVAKNSLAKEMFFVLGGEVVIKNSEGDNDITLGPGSLFGELALLYNIRRTATVEAATDCSLAVLTKSDLERLSNSQPELYERIKDIADQRFEMFKHALRHLAPGKINLNDIESYNEQLEYFRDVFTSMDTTKSEEIGLDQLKGLLERLFNRKVSTEEAQYLFSLMDKDGDGKINFNEFVLGLRHIAWVLPEEGSKKKDYLPYYVGVTVGLVAIVSSFLLYRRCK